jgi:hypothetical protein
MNLVKQIEFLDNEDSLPQAIFWRSVYYFSTEVTSSEDDLDEFQVAAFSIGNWSNFDVRRYRNDPHNIASLYIPQSIRQEHLFAVIEQILKVFLVPISAIAWKRGQEFEFGRVDRAGNDQLREAEARILCLKIASQCEGHEASMSYIKSQIHKFTNFSKRDLRLSPTRENEPMWQQIIRNVISHESTKTGIFHRGLARKTKKGIKVTDDGLRYLERIGFSREFSIQNDPELHIHQQQQY